MVHRNRAGHAKAHSAPILDRLMGARITFDGHDVVEPDPSGSGPAMRSPAPSSWPV